MMDGTLTADQVRMRLSYDPLTGELRYKVRTVDTFEDSIHSAAIKCKTWNAKYAGLIAGSINGEGYISVGIDGSYYQAHILAYLIMTGEWPKDQIDHRDTVRHNNKWENLREATQNKNQWNKRRCKNNTSGFKGVSWHSKSQKWQAYISVRGKRIHLGLFNSPEEAHAAYVAAAKCYFGEFARAA